MNNFILTGLLHAVLSMLSLGLCLLFLGLISNGTQINDSFWLIVSFVLLCWSNIWIWRFFFPKR